MRVAETPRTPVAADRSYAWFQCHTARLRCAAGCNRLQHSPCVAYGLLARSLRAPGSQQNCYSAYLAACPASSRGSGSSEPGGTTDTLDELAFESLHPEASEIGVRRLGADPSFVRLALLGGRSAMHDADYLRCS